MTERPPRQHDEEQLLRDAQAKAQKLIDGLVAQAADLDRFAGQLAPDKLAQGQEAFARAIESTRRTVEGIEHALRHHAAAQHANGD